MKATRFRILLVEGTPKDARLIRKKLIDASPSPCELKTVDSLPSGLESIRKSRANVVLLDLALPDVQGLKALHQFRAGAPKVPIVVLTERDDEALGIRAVREGAQDYLVKGRFDGQLLTRSLRYAIERGQMQSTLERRTQELKTSENRLRKIIQEDTDGIVVMDRKGIVLFANPATEAILGKKLGSLIGKHLNLPLAFGERKEIDIPLGKDYSRTAETRVVEMEWGGENALLVSLHDITEQKIAENHLQESRRFSESIIETATDAFVMMDSCGLILDWNRKAEEMFGWTRDEALYRSLIETIFPPRHREYHLKSVTDFLTSGEGPFLSTEIEHTAIHRDGREFPVEFNFWPIRDGETYRLSAFIRDISELKELQQMKDEFMRTVSHEIRTPMTTIREGISQVQEGLLGDTTEEQREYFSMILDDIDRLTRIINDLLDASRFESGGVRLNISRIDIAELVGGIRSQFQPQAEEKGLEIETRLPKGNILIEADRDKIIQVLTNLMGNAVKFTQKGHIGISISREKESIKCCVSDTGEGISKEDLPRIFDKFQQFGKANGSQEKGTGLGLYIAKAIVELHHGKIWVESRPKKGTAFYFSLPEHQEAEALAGR